MAPMMLGKKLGMTRVYDEAGRVVPVTVIELGPCVVTQVRTPERDGYSAVQIGFGEKPARNATIPMIGHDAKAGTTPKRYHAEFRTPEGDASFEQGQVLTAADMADVKYVDVIGVSKGKGFQGGMKRHNFAGLEASHGVERKHRSIGSIGGHSSWRGGAGGPKKGKRMPGHMGDEQITVRSLDVVKIDAERNLMLVKGPVPGANRSLVRVRPAIRLYRSKSASAG